MTYVGMDQNQVANLLWSPGQLGYDFHWGKTHGFFRSYGMYIMPPSTKLKYHHLLTYEKSTPMCMIVYQLYKMIAQ